jgi:hypothetical protein
LLVGDAADQADKLEVQGLLGLVKFFNDLLQLFGLEIEMDMVHCLIQKFPFRLKLVNDLFFSSFGLLVFF